MHTCLLFRLFIPITSSNIAFKAKHDQIVALKTTGISNRDKQKSDLRYKTVVNVWKPYTETATTSSKPILDRKRSTRTNPSRFGIFKDHLCKGYFKII